MTGPIRYTADKGIQTWFELFDERVDWMTLGKWAAIVIIVWIVIAVLKGISKRRES